MSHSTSPDGEAEARTRMTSTMRAFLEQAAECECDRGILLDRGVARIASKATSDGYGWQIVAPLKVFIINDKGREALKAQP